MTDRAPRQPPDFARRRRVVRRTDHPSRAAPAASATPPDRPEPRVPPADRPAPSHPDIFMPAAEVRPLPVRPRPNRADPPPRAGAANPLSPFRRRRMVLGALLPSLWHLGWGAPESDLFEDEQPGD